MEYRNVSKCLTRALLSRKCHQLHQHTTFLLLFCIFSPSRCKQLFTKEKSNTSLKKTCSRLKVYQAIMTESLCLANGSYYLVTIGKCCRRWAQQLPWKRTLPRTWRRQSGDVWCIKMKPHRHRRLQKELCVAIVSRELRRWLIAQTVLSLMPFLSWKVWNVQKADGQASCSKETKRPRSVERSGLAKEISDKCTNHFRHITAA